MPIDSGGRRLVSLAFVFIIACQMLFGWEAMGVCSFMLIGHWWEEKENSNAALKAVMLGDRK